MHILDRFFNKSLRPSSVCSDTNYAPVLNTVYMLPARGDRDSWGELGMFANSARPPRRIQSKFVQPNVWLFVVQHLPGVR